MFTNILSVQTTAMVGRHASLPFLFLNLLSCFLFTSAALYNSTDNVVLLDNNNFASLVYDTENAWIIEFYNSWCGHCISFAPLWKIFAKNVIDWDHTVKVGVVDCSVDDNMPLCREYEIMGYPTIKLFASRCSQGDLGTDMPQTTSIDAIENHLIDFLAEKQKANNGSSTWVKLQPYEGSITDLWSEAPSPTEHVVIVLDQANSRNARGSILDLGGYSSVYMRYQDSTANNQGKYRSASFPILIISDKTGKEETINTNGKTHREISALLMRKFGLNRGMLPYKNVLTGMKNKSTKKEDMEGAGDGQPEEINSDILNYEDDLPDTAFSGSERQDQVYMVDIENAISYALNHEVAQHKFITGDALIALQEFLDVLVRYLPARPAIHNFLSKLHQYTLNNGNTIEGTKFQTNIQSLQSRDSVLPDHQPWIGCLGSEEKYRGYPCGLWTTFHVLTVNAVLKDGTKKYYNPKKPLKAIHGYVKHFFGCRYCSEHFQAMYTLDAESSVNVADDGILWLWKGHNKANKRLKGDKSEDPNHPKQQFPPKTFCPACWEGSQFNEREVLTYLKGLYAKQALSFRGTQNFSTVRNRQSKVMEELEGYKREKKNVVTVKRITKQELEAPSSWGFNMTDISLCVFLYGISTVIIMGVYCWVVVRRKMRRRKFLEAYKLPVNAEKPLECPSS